MTTTRDRWQWAAALAFIILTLAALILIPVFVQRRVDQQRERIEDSEPARTLLMGLQFNLVREISTMNQFVATRDSAYVRTFRSARAAERDIWMELEPLARSLGPAVLEKFVRARTIAELWHERLNEDELIRRGMQGMSLLVADDVRQRFEQVLWATDQLDSSILAETRTTRAKIERAEESGILFTAISGLLALLAASVAAALVRRVRRLAAEAERRRAEATAALAESARAADARQRLLRGVTHDVKNPLGAARGYADLLVMGVKGPLNADQEKLVAGMERSINGALAIISDLLDLSRADSGAMQIERVPADLAEIARQAVDDHRAAAQAVGHEITFAGKADRAAVITDPLRVRQVLDNLISNAIKYTPAPGRITVQAEPNAPDAPFARRSVALRVTDNGPGIPAEQRERIFDEFTRLDDHGAAQGHGLGLAIARRMSRVLGGELALADRDGAGSTFVLWLPAREA
jgi:signal transduction histidine kinase